MKQQTHRIGQVQPKETVTTMDTLRDTWRVLKPFVHFSVRALKAIGYVLIYIVKNIPKPQDNKSARKHDKIIKI